VIQINGRVRASFEGTQLALKGPLDRGDFAQPLALPAMPKLVPRGPAPLNLSALQRRLIALRFLPTGTASGKWDYRTQQAVLAFQGWVGETKDGIVGTATRAELELATLPKPTRSRSGSWIEVHRKKGVALLVRDGRVVQAVHVSSGAPGYTTPSGAYRIFRKERNSWSVPYRVWLPYASYFNGGIAFHEWSEIPPQPASHGCVRIPAPEAAAVYAFAANGTAVYVS
jgi:lipoprotein-anchoring transpeptidase ErfK/SrfK